MRHNPDIRLTVVVFWFQGQKYVLASQSIEHPKCPLSPSIIRAQVSENNPDV